MNAVTPIADSPRPARRTQEERKAEMVRRLLDAAIMILSESGYADATVQRICARAEVSQGALFRHFASKEDFMAAVGIDVSVQTLTTYRQHFEALPPIGSSLRPALELLRRICRLDISIVWVELSVAARTRPQLREVIAPVRLEHHRASIELARALVPQVAASLGARFGAVMELIMVSFEGECAECFVTPRPHVDDARLDLLISLIENMMEQAK